MCSSLILNITADLCIEHINIQQHDAYLRLKDGDAWGLTQGVTLGVTEGVTEGVPLGVDCADVGSLSSFKSPLGIFNFCTEKTINIIESKRRLSTDRE